MTWIYIKYRRRAAAGRLRVAFTQMQCLRSHTRKPSSTTRVLLFYWQTKLGHWHVGHGKYIYNVQYSVTQNWSCNLGLLFAIAQDVSLAD